MRNLLARIAGRAVERPTPVIVAAVLLTLLGAVAALRLEADRSPSSLVDRGSSPYAATQSFYRSFGDEPVEVLEQIERPVVKAFAMGATARIEEADTWPARVRLLIDVHDPDQRGGTGKTVDWNQAAAIAARRPVLLAGGLNAGNVADAIHQVRPFGIDVSSGVESSPGVKDHARMRALFEAVMEGNR